MISIGFLRLSGKSISKPPDLIFQSCIKQGEFPEANGVPVHKETETQILTL